LIATIQTWPSLHRFGRVVAWEGECGRLITFVSLVLSLWRNQCKVFIICQTRVTTCIYALFIFSRTEMLVEYRCLKSYHIHLIDWFISIKKVCCKNTLL
jgi:hypothetical protein